MYNRSPFCLRVVKGEISPKNLTDENRCQIFIVFPKYFFRCLKLFFYPRYPHLNRGDLYTKQGILSMLQAGIKVEPLLMKVQIYIIDFKKWGIVGGRSLKAQF